MVSLLEQEAIKAKPSNAFIGTKEVPTIIINPFDKAHMDKKLFLSYIGKYHTLLFNKFPIVDNHVQQLIN